jgi:hypothetical protein
MLFPLPDISTKSVIVKREADKPDLSTLKESQLAVFSGISQCLRGNDGGIIILEGIAGAGKAQPLYSKIATPDGFKLMGDVRIGDAVFGADGEVYNITGIYPQGIKDVYRVWFTDYTYVDCCAEHLWKVYSYKDRYTNHNRKYNKDSFSILTTHEILNTIRAKNGKQLNYKLPTCGAVQYSAKEYMIHPYVMGVILGDGGCTGSAVVISSSDDFILNKVSNLLLPNFKLSYRSQYDYSIVCMVKNQVEKYNMITRYIEYIGLKCKSADKFIPTNYMHGSIEQRIHLLQGLMDTDGTVGNKGHLSSYSSSSITLATNVAELVRSLGGVATVLPKKTKCLMSYRVNINLGDVDYFSLPRKLNLVVPKTKYKHQRYISRVEVLPATEMQCISVNAPDKLYLTDNFTVTHNTYITSRIIEAYLNEFPQHSIVFAATTNRAVKVAYSSTEYRHPNLDYSTIHRELGLKEKLQNDGSIDFLPDKHVEPSIKYRKVVFIDESSQFSRKLMPYLLPYVYNGVKVVFIGDPFQTPPVREIDSLVFNEAWQVKNNAVVFKLTEIVRQAADNPIIELTTLIRNRIGIHTDLGEKYGYKNKLWQSDKGVYFVKHSLQHDRMAFDALLKHVFTSANFQSDATFGKVVAWRNKTVNTINRGIRRLIYKTDKLRRIEPGEKLVTKSPVFDPLDLSAIIINNSEDLEVVDFTKHEESINRGQWILPFYDTQVRYTNMFGEAVYKNILIPTDKGLKVQIEVLELLAEVANSYKFGTLGSANAWREFWNFKKQWADISYAYAGTVHLSQGGTFNNCIVLSQDILANPKILERNKILYTACSRPKERLFIL